MNVDTTLLDPLKWTYLMKLLISTLARNFPVAACVDLCMCVDLCITCVLMC